MKTIHKLLIAFSISLVMLMAGYQCNAQTSPNVKAKTEVASATSLTKNATKTTLLYKGLPVYKSSKGSYFVIKQSKKTGNWYKLYITVG